MMVSSLSTFLRANMLNEDIEQVASKEETAKRKAKFLSVLDKTLQQFNTALESGLVQMNSIADLEKIVRLTLLVSGEAEAIVEGRKQDGTEVKVISVDEEEVIRNMLNAENPDVAKVFEMILNRYNEFNDEQSEVG